MRRFDPATPRWRYWANAVVGDARCPRCDTALIRDHQTYLISATWSHEADYFLCGTEAGHFCPNCPSCVLDCSELEEMISLHVDTWRFKYEIEGIVDLASVPEDSREKELGASENPLPLVEFRNAAGVRKSKRRRHSGKFGNVIDRRAR